MTTTMACVRGAIAATLFATACVNDPPTAPPVLARLELSFSSRVVTVRQQISVRAIAYGSSNRRMATPPLEWTSDDPSIATIDPYGLITGHQIGSVVIRATSGDVQAGVEIVVRPARVRISLRSGSADLLVGGTAVLIAEYVDAVGQLVQGTEAVHWSTSDNGVVRVDSTSGDPMQREFTARTTGLARISAFAMGVEGRFIIAVVSPPESNPPVAAKDFHIAETWGIWDELILVPSLRVAVSPGRSVELVRLEVALGLGLYYPSLCSSARLLAGEHELLGTGSYPSPDDFSLRWYELPVIPRGVALLTYREGASISTVAVREPENAATHNALVNGGLTWRFCS